MGRKGYIHILEHAGLQQANLPTTPSSAGVPNTTRRPGRDFMAAFTASPAARLDMAMRLWPQPWPMPGSASYSAVEPRSGHPRCRPA